ncbi:putative DNA-binding protein with an HTH domain [Xenococcus sp. PCC 7305]|uniref:ribbon-helix-helix domain-containing protein n=1 Tax=Xenococcus sp. PCC 7305 TaxID=102125 RepID=UPI0002ABBE5A|nr:CopG family transcriptional regulator [Xenococcus sp. PCC 7305]ELS05111.1 putative DNA-binding protein with an HTH domain [Xenococcus sp. PCC 7305]
MSQVVSTRLPDDTAERLKRFARRLGKTPSETGAMLIEESLRETEFAFIEFRNSAVGRSAYMKNSNLAVWQVMIVARKYDLQPDKIVRHFQRPLEWVLAALNYAEAYPVEIEDGISDYRALNYTALKRILPQVELIKVPSEVLVEQ